MKPNSILYYPRIEFQSEAWVKSSLLLWDHVYRIVPEDYIPNDSNEIKALLDEDMIRNIKLDDKDKSETCDEFLKLCDRLEIHMPAGLVPSDEDRIHPDKIDARLYPYLDLIGEYFVDDDRWLHLSKELARGYMFKLSQVVARIRNLNRGTDDLDAWSINPYFCEDANFGDFLQDPDAKGFYCSVTLEDVIPKNVGAVSSKELISFVKKRKDEKRLLREKFDEMTSHLAKVSNVCHSGQVNMDFINELRDAKEQYRNSMDSWKDIAACSITTGIPVSLSALGTFRSFDILKQNPFELISVAGSILIGAICSYVDFSRVKINRDPSYASYLIQVDKLCRNVSHQSYNLLNEFVND